MFYLLYNLFSVVLLLPVCLFTVYRAFKLNWPLALAARFGRIPATELAKLQRRPVILVHAVSVGEVIAARTLLKALRCRYPDHALVVSNGTETGRQTAMTFAEVDLCVYFPFDFLPSVRLMLDALRPALVIIMETEIWPNFNREAAVRSIPLVLANGRISDRSYGRYLKMSWFFRHALRNFSLLCMQSEITRERIIAIGAPAERVVVSGNLKFDIPCKLTTDAEKQSLRNRYRIAEDCLVITAGSTHPGEEELLVQIYRELLQKSAKIILVLAPRHPERSPEVAALLESAGFVFRRFTELEPGDVTMLGGGELLLMDTVGELLNLYSLADIGFVGGSMIPKGGHNLLEPASCGLPVIFGTHMANFREIAALVIGSQAGLQVGDEVELSAELQRLISDPQERQRLGRNGLEMVKINGGATHNHLDKISPLLSGQ